jgi:hypothetical protein
MPDFSNLDYWMILVALPISIAVGVFFRSPRGIGKRWSKFAPIRRKKMPEDYIEKPEPENEAAKTISFVAFSALLQVAALVGIVHSLRITETIKGLVIAGLLWLCLIVATGRGNLIYVRLGWNYWWFMVSYFLSVTVAISLLILAYWR